MSNPYFAPYTAPDGTTRRPIVERVPQLNQLDPDDGPYSREAELALCRCAVEDWIGGEVACLKHIHVKPLDGRPHWHIWEWEKYATPASTHEHADIHHALTSAAHAVADALGVAP